MSEAETTKEIKAPITWVSMRAYAKHKAVHPKTVKQAIENGRVVQNPSTLLINLEESDKFWEANLNKPSRKIQKIDEGESVAAQMSRAKLEKEQHASKMSKLKFDQMSGKLIEIKAVEALWSKIITTAKTRLLSIPSKVRGRIPKLNADEALIIDEEIRLALDALASQSLDDLESDKVFDDEDDESDSDEIEN